MIYEAVKQKYNNYNITIVFQPHTYSRTIYLNKEFKDVLKDKEVYIMKTFISREEYDLLKESVVKEIFINHKEYDVNVIKEILNKENQIILCLGAGDIHNEIKKWHNKCKL
jgi:UDP-N-acetylmuramate--alanine ligase